MEFDVKKYTEVFDRFLLNMADIRDPFVVNIKPEVRDLCEMLRIGRVQVDFYETFQDEKLGNVKKLVFYDSQDIDETRAYRARKISGKGNVAVYQVFQKLGDEDWSIEETEKIQVFVSVLFSFHGRARLKEIAENLTFYDQALKMPNMAFYMRAASKLLAQGRLHEYGLCFLNLKRFSNVNQCLGRELGTMVMKKYMMKLQEKLGEDGIVCRVGGDNFLVSFRKEQFDIVKQHLKGDEVTYNAQTGERIKVYASAGYYLIPEHMKDIDAIVERAHLACQSAKNNVGKKYVFYDEQLMVRKDHLSHVESVFPEALENGEFLVYYQPKVRLNSYKLAGAEALCRWNHQGRLIAPNDFIPILEQTSAICSLDFYMLEHVCRDIRRWLNAKQNVVRISVNFSRRHMGDTKLLERILSIIDKYQVPHELLEIELTETTTDIEFQDLKQIVCGLREQGIGTSVDDFGVGYSSLNLIRQVPWDVIKIDRSLLPEHVNENSDQTIMLQNLLTMLQEMGLKCIVEGVETVEQVKLLKENNCYFVQGFYFDRPLEAAEFERRLNLLS
ncbi:MAG: putative bifunctional diguanylate cyclase/phosphodiesterase [Wujia sp.]